MAMGDGDRARNSSFRKATANAVYLTIATVNNGDCLTSALMEQTCEIV